MYIDTSYPTQRGKTYCRHLLREFYRDNGKVKHRTLAKLSHCEALHIAMGQCSLYLAVQPRKSKRIGQQPRSQVDEDKAFNDFECYYTSGSHMICKGK